jgi:hypothetical protein
MLGGATGGSPAAEGIIVASSGSPGSVRSPGSAGGTDEQPPAGICNGPIGIAADATVG